MVLLVAGQRPCMVWHIFGENCEQARIGLMSQVINFSVARIGHGFKKLLPFFQIHEWGFWWFVFSICRSPGGLRNWYGFVLFLRWGNNRFLGKSKKDPFEWARFFAVTWLSSGWGVFLRCFAVLTYAAFPRILAIIVASMSSGK